METQQFHLKWNNHSLNTLSSFQQLLDSNTLVDVSLTCSNGKTVTAHRIVLAACSDYFYHLFRDLPEKHPVIVFKDAGEEIVRDLLLFMYKGEVEVQESYLNDFLKFADTLQVKGLSQSDKNPTIPPSAAAAVAAATASDPPSNAAKDAKSKVNNNNNKTTRADSPNNKNAAAAADQPIPLIKANNNNNDISPTPPSTTASSNVPMSHPSVQEMAKNYLASLGKFPGIFPGMNPEKAAALAAVPPPPGADLFGHLSSPTLYHALQRKYPENPVLFKQMPLFKKMFGENAEQFASLYPNAGRDNDDSDSIAERSPPPPATSLPLPIPPSMPAGFSPASIPGLMKNFPLTPNVVSPSDGENGFDRVHAASPMDSDHSPYPPSSLSGANTPSGNVGVEGSPKSDENNMNNGKDGSPTKRIGGSVKSAAGRGSRLERMIAAEYKIMSEYSDVKTDAALPVMTPELMKSRRTHSLQLAIAEIMHNRASVQSAATKYHIPRETLRRHYQRYIKTMGIEKPPSTNNRDSPGGGPPPRPGSNNNAKLSSAISSSLMAGSPIMTTTSSSPSAKDAADTSNGFSSLMELGQAFGIWNSDSDGLAAQAAAARAHLEKAKAAAAAQQAAAGATIGSDDKIDKADKLVIDEEDINDVEVDDDEPLSPGGPEDEHRAPQGSTPPPSNDEDEAMDPSAAKKARRTPPPPASAPMETSA